MFNVVDQSILDKNSGLENVVEEYCVKNRG